MCQPVKENIHGDSVGGPVNVGIGGCGGNGDIGKDAARTLGVIDEGPTHVEIPLRVVGIAVRKILVVMDVQGDLIARTIKSRVLIEGTSVVEQTRSCGSVAVPNINVSIHRDIVDVCTIICTVSAEEI